MLSKNPLSPKEQTVFKVFKLRFIKEKKIKAIIGLFQFVFKFKWILCAGEEKKNSKVEEKNFSQKNTVQLT